MANVTVTYGSESPGNAITSTKWNQNMSDLTNGLSDGTKTLQPAGVTCTGTIQAGKLVSTATATVNNLISSGVITAPSMGTTLANAVLQTFQRTTGTSVTTPNIAISTSSGSFSSSSASYVDVTNLSVTLTTTGRPVMIMLIPDNNGTNPSVFGAQANSDFVMNGYFQILRGASVLSQYQIEGEFGSTSANLYFYTGPSSIALIDPVSAGTYTYKMQVKKTIGAGNMIISYCCLAAWEL